MERLREITRAIQGVGGQAFITGGFVRDTIMGRPSKDIDVEVFGVQPEILESVLAQFGKVVYCGESFGVFKLEGFDFSLPRRERKRKITVDHFEGSLDELFQALRKSGAGYTGFDVSIDPFMSIEEACKRRDFTMNAMLMNPITGEIIDPFGGREDIERGVIRHVNDETFAEDPLRVLRAAQFAARFDFEVDLQTKRLCMSLLKEMPLLSYERFMIEVDKIMMKAVRPSVAFRFLEEVGVLPLLFPEIAVMRLIEQGTLHHPEGDVLEHTFLALDSVPIEQRTLVHMLAILCHDMGKVDAPIEKESEEIIHFNGHAEEGEETVRRFLGRLTNEIDVIESVVPLVKYHMRPYEFKRELKRATLRRLALHMEEDSGGRMTIEDLMVIHRADMSGKPVGVGRDFSHIHEVLALWVDIRDEIKPLIKGRHLIDHFDLTPSKNFGSILRAIFDAQLDGKFSTFEEGLAFTATFLLTL